MEKFGGWSTSQCYPFAIKLAILGLFEDIDGMGFEDSFQSKVSISKLGVIECVFCAWLETKLVFWVFMELCLIIGQGIYLVGYNITN